MTIPMLITLSLTLAALCISIFALIVVRRSSAQSLSSQLSEHSILLEQLAHQLRNIRARLNMQAYRARKRGESPESEENGVEVAPAAAGSTEWKRKMNLQLALRGTPK